MRTALISLAVSLIASAAMASPTAELTPLRGIHTILVLGDSITYAGGYVDVIDAYLVRHYPGRYTVIDVGLPSETVSGLSEPNHAGGAFPRPDLAERLSRVLEQVKPQMVVACYGMNDGIYQPYSDERFGRYTVGIANLRKAVAGAGADLWLVTPPPFDEQPIRSGTTEDGVEATRLGRMFRGYDEVLARYSAWLVGRRKAGWKVIDIHTPLRAYLAARRASDAGFTLAPDGVHLDSTGHRLVARGILAAWGVPATELPPATAPAGDRLLDQVHQRRAMMTDAWLTATGHKRPGMAVGAPMAEAIRTAAELDARAVAVASRPTLPGTCSDYHGYDRYDFTVDGCRATLVAPNGLPAAGKPWIWRAEFFDHQPQLDLALLSRGFHLAYIEVGNTFGCPSAMKHWDAFYGYLTANLGLGRKPVLEGLSRGGLYIYNWASAHPRSVSVLFGDNPVCDFKSWPGGKGKGPGSPDDWKKLQADYGFGSEAEAMAFKLNPIDNLAPLARAHVPILHLCGDADEVVPYPENTVILADRYRKLGGTVEVIIKPGLHHHPHGLDDPTPLVDFILKHMKR